MDIRWNEARYSLTSSEIKVKDPQNRQDQDADQMVEALKTTLKEWESSLQPSGLLTYAYNSYFRKPTTSCDTLFRKLHTILYNLATNNSTTKKISLSLLNKTADEVTKMQAAYKQKFQQAVPEIFEEIVARVEEIKTALSEYEKRNKPKPVDQATLAIEDFHFIDDNDNKKNSTTTNSTSPKQQQPRDGLNDKLDPRGDNHPPQGTAQDPSAQLREPTPSGVHPLPENQQEQDGTSITTEEASTEDSSIEDLLMGDLEDLEDLLPKEEYDYENAALQLQGYNAQAPLKGLSNPNSACYINAFMQILHAIPSLRQALMDPIDDPEANGPKAKLRQAFIEFFSQHLDISNGCEPKNHSSKDKTAISDLRKAIFASNLNPTEFAMEDLTKQMDVNALVTLFIDSFLSNSHLKMQKHMQTEVIPGVDFLSSVQSEAALRLYIPETPHPVQLLDLIDTDLSAQEVDNEFKFSFNPNQRGDTVILDAQQAPTQSINVAVNNFQLSHTLKALPEVLFIQLKCFKMTENAMSYLSSRKINTEVEMPADGIIDLKDYCDLGEENQLPTQYKIKGMITHSGLLQAGHYISFVEINGKYYKCDDNYTKEITLEEFLKPSTLDLLHLPYAYLATTPYMIVLERLK
jgi:chemotaxis protein histidine kinase CheA